MALRDGMMQEPTGDLARHRIEFRQQADEERQLRENDLSDPLSVRSQAVAMSRSRTQAMREQAAQSKSAEDSSDELR